MAMFAPTITPQELHTKILSGEKLTVIDVRSVEEFADGHIDSAINIPTEQLQGRVDEFKREEPVYVICHSGSRSKLSTIFLLRNGVENLYDVKGGMSAWESAGLPVVQ